MKIIYNKFLIISTVTLLIGGAYLYFSRDLNSNGIVPVAYGSSLSSSIGLDISAISSSMSEKITSDISFLNTLVSLKKIKIETTLFSNKSFNSLKNNTVTIESVIAGRPNPFAPINSNTGNDLSVPSVVTNQPTQITDKTATLNGTVNITSGVGDTYFEYGNTEILGTATTVIKPSLVGSFVKNISGLNSKTTYFFKACAKVNNIKLCGEAVSFTTN